MKSCEQFAIEWNLSKRTINNLCNKGKIPGTIKEGRKWLIPDDAVRPVDKRVSSGKYAKKKVANNKLLPIGISDYVRAQADYYYVDKTLLIKELCSCYGEVRGNHATDGKLYSWKVTGYIENIFILSV